MARTKLFRRRGYHHGNLREALVAAARRLIAARGPAGFTLVEAARLAGVSAAAPYRHFADRDALLAEVAERGFAEFAARLQAAWRHVGRDPGAAFRRMGEAYLAFAREEPGFYGAMFSAGVPAVRARRAPGRRAGKRPSGRTASFAALETAVAQMTAVAGMTADPLLLACEVWALSHGIATLAAAGQLPAGDARLKPRALLRSGVAALIAGAGRKPAPRRQARRPSVKRGGRGGRTQ